MLGHRGARQAHKCPAEFLGANSRACADELQNVLPGGVRIRALSNVAINLEPVARGEHHRSRHAVQLRKNIRCDADGSRTEPGQELEAGTPAFRAANRFGTPVPVPENCSPVRCAGMMGNHKSKLPF
jgi:hypothetical protein